MKIFFFQRKENEEVEEKRGKERRRITNERNKLKKAVFGTEYLTVC